MTPLHLNRLAIGWATTGAPARSAAGWLHLAMQSLKRLGREPAAPAARPWPTDPSAPTPTQIDRLIREAAAVRRLASRHQLCDRGFAADLYAAADRHERGLQG